MHGGVDTLITSSRRLLQGNEARLLATLHLNVLDCRLDGVLCQHATVQLHRGKAQVLGNVRVSDSAGLHYCLPFDPLSCYAATGNCGRTSKCFEAAIHDVALIIHLDLNLHHIATGRGTYKPGTHIRVLFVKGTHVAGVLVVVHHLFVVELVRNLQQGPSRGNSSSSVRQHSQLC